LVNADIILASRSPRRRELLDQVGVRYLVLGVDVDESIRPGEPAADYVRRVGMEKARRAAASPRQHELPVLAADTAVVLDGVILGKPEHAEEAANMLRRLSGHTHAVYSAVVLHTLDGSLTHRLSISKVSFAPLDPDWILAYCACGEPLDKAGAYAIQGYAAGCITRLEGSYSGVMGLPLHETIELLRDAGIDTLPRVNVK